MFTVTGKAIKRGEIPSSHSDALVYFSDIPTFLQKIEDVDKVKALSHPDSYLVRHHPIGGLSYFVTLVYAMKVEKAEDGYRFKPLDFDVEKITSEHHVLKGFVDGHLKLNPLDDGRSTVEVAYTMNLEFPLPSALKLVPRPLIQSTADGIMHLKVTNAIEAMYKKVLTDFSLSPA